jgi:hypothetical protein
MGGMVRDAKGAPDHRGHPPAGPDLAAEAVRLRSPLHQGGQLSELLWSQPRLAARGGMASQRLYPRVPRARLSHWLTAPAVTPSAAAMSCCFQPASSSSQARRRRPSRQSSCGLFVFMAPTYQLFTPLRKGQ